MTSAGARDRYAVALGGALGAWLRFGLLAAAASVVGSPVGALAAVVVANLAGTYLLGWVSGRAEHDPRWAARSALLGTGLAGALTTFSGLALQLTAVVEILGVAGTAALATAHVVAGIVLVRVGVHAGRQPRGGPR